MDCFFVGHIMVQKFDELASNFNLLTDQTDALFLMQIWEW